MPNNLTDAEIKKALECCSAGVCKAECFGYFIAGTNDCTTQLAKYALDLINRKTTRLRKVEHQLDDALKMYNTIKAEAYKEFAELVHCHCESIINQEWNKKVSPVSWADAYKEFDNKVDNILNELVGDA